DGTHRRAQARRGCTFPRLSGAAAAGGGAVALWPDRPAPVGHGGQAAGPGWGAGQTARALRCRRVVPPVPGAGGNLPAAPPPRLLWTVGGVTGFVTLLVSLAVGQLLRSTDNRPTQVQVEMEQILYSDRPTAAERLRGSASDLRHRQGYLEKISHDPEFPTLPA